MRPIGSMVCGDAEAVASVAGARYLIDDRGRFRVAGVTEATRGDVQRRPLGARPAAAESASAAADAGEATGAYDSSRHWLLDATAIVWCSPSRWASPWTGSRSARPDRC